LKEDVSVQGKLVYMDLKKKSNKSLKKAFQDSFKSFRYKYSFMNFHQEISKSKKKS